MRLRSLLFVPADRPERFAKAVASGADAIILDLEDSVAAARKDYARGAIRDWLSEPRECLSFVRVNPLGSAFVADDLETVLGTDPAALLLPKAEGAASVRAILGMAGSAPVPPILPIATETPAAVFELGSYREVRDHLVGLTWGAEDLPAAIGASSAREPDGSYTAPYELARSLTLFAAHATGVAALETVFPKIDAPEALDAYVRRARRDGFVGMMAIHPGQVPVINAAFMLGPDEIDRARRIIAAFEASPGAGALQLDGAMIDAPHLKQARALLAQAGEEI
ncbi:MAG: CoA ester lyase [Sphingomonas sp. 66-10]|uniref:HpcH/HpaI aldolase/citrate lyase family protein n=1 Tax=Sphingomonas sp. 66-10 TaxID=1895848 RepID=UPI00086A3AB0|nr:CoA ester lyase [Sphingomonas sp. 66-10]ODU67929.1 MAG: citrate lyase [Novosphingobium sp. SCN 66-18]OJU18225.1 MAG: CoA ester lyase [Sphingomonas sp. 66-10]